MVMAPATSSFPYRFSLVRIVASLAEAASMGEQLCIAWLLPMILSNLWILQTSNGLFALRRAFPIGSSVTVSTSP
jgi:hypothetical protein